MTPERLKEIKLYAETIDGTSQMAELLAEIAELEAELHSWKESVKGWKEAHHSAIVSSNHELKAKDEQILSLKAELESLKLAQFESAFTLKLKDLGFDQRFLEEYRDLKMKLRDVKADYAKEVESLLEQIRRLKEVMNAAKAYIRADGITCDVRSCGCESSVLNLALKDAEEALAQTEEKTK